MNTKRSLHNLLFVIAALFFVAIGPVHAATPGPTKATAPAEAVLHDFLVARSKGAFDQCATYLAGEYLAEFKKEYGADFVSYFTKQDEDHFLTAEIVARNVQDDGSIMVGVSSTVEIDGERSLKSEHFYLKQVGGVWKIVDWEIEY